MCLDTILPRTCHGDKIAAAILTVTVSLIPDKTQTRIASYDSARRIDIGVDQHIHGA